MVEEQPNDRDGGRWRRVIQGLRVQRPKYLWWDMVVAAGQQLGSAIPHLGQHSHHRNEQSVEGRKRNQRRYQADPAGASGRTLQRQSRARRKRYRHFRIVSDRLSSQWKLG